MAVVNLVGFHARRDKGGWSFLQANAPFLSENNSRQWLGQGFYFWYENDEWAHAWGKTSIDAKRYAVLRCDVQMERDELLDLVGSPKDGETIKKLMGMVRDAWKSRGHEKLPPLGKAVEFLKDHGKFPYKCVKVQDQKSKDNTKYYFRDKGGEYMRLGYRQKFCLYEGNEGCINEKKIVYPAEYQKRHEAYSSAKG